MSLVSGKNYSTEFTSRKNIIINGNFDVWQRGTSFAATGSGTYTSDRFEYNKVGTGVHTITRDTNVPTTAESGLKSNYSIKLDVTTADTDIAATDFYDMRYIIEGYDYAMLAGSNATLSFWVKGAKTGIHCVSFINSGIDRSYVAEYTINVADTWEKKTITVPLTETAGTWDYTTGVGVRVYFTLAAGTTYQTTENTWQTGQFYATSNQVNELDNIANNFQIAQVQIETGTEATEFEKRHYADELALCHRYYWRNAGTTGSGYMATTGSLSSMTSLEITYPTQMRANPVVAIVTAPVYTNCSAAAMSGGTDGFVVRVQATAAGRFRTISGVYEADAEL